MWLGRPLWPWGICYKSNDGFVTSSVPVVIRSSSGLKAAAVLQPFISNVLTILYSLLVWLTSLLSWLIVSRGNNFEFSHGPESPTNPWAVSMSDQWMLEVVLVLVDGAARPRLCHAGGGSHNYKLHAEDRKERFERQAQSVKKRSGGQVRKKNPITEAQKPGRSVNNQPKIKRAAGVEAEAVGAVGGQIDQPLNSKKAKMLRNEVAVVDSH